ncbi:MAG: glycosyltransferase family 9 protein [Deltaproteobacteria bacterium]|nr:glycosyltransferase family 9 protein [Deltaproteobacteria bacterium]
MWNRLVEKTLRTLLQSRVKNRPPRPFELADMDRVKRILLMTTTAIGDTLFSTPAIRAVKEMYPEKEVDVLCHIRNGLLLQENPYVNRLFFFRGKARKIFPLLKSLKEQRYDLVIILHGNDPESVPLAWGTKAPFIIGSGTSRFAFLLSQGVICTDEKRHAIERRLDLVRVIGADTGNKKMALFLPADWGKKAEQILHTEFKDAAGPLVGLHPTGSGGYKWWPAEHFAALGGKIADQYQARFIIFCSRAEASVARTIASRIGAPVLLVEGRYNLLEAAALMKKCNLFIANDSGPLHMALALGVPSIALIGADSPLRIGPYQAENAAYLYRKDQVCDVRRCLNERCPDNRCMKEILPQEVFDMVSDRFLKYLVGGPAGFDSERE